MDLTDLHDHEVAALAKVWYALQQKYMTKPNSKYWLQELAKEAHGSFLKLGLVVEVKWENNLVIDPNTMQPFPIEIDVLGRVPGSVFEQEGVVLYDHERQRHEVLAANERGEKYYGQKERPH